MRLNIENIGKLQSASVDINGITIIAGENNTGKSTIGKTLYCLFSAFHNINDKINEERASSIYQAISRPIRKNFPQVHPRKIRKLVDDICSEREMYIQHPDELETCLINAYKTYFDNTEEFENFNTNSVIERVLSYLKLDDNIIKSNVLKKFLASEFNMQVGNINAKDLNSVISLEIHGKKIIDVLIEKNENIDIKCSVDVYSNLVYIEDPFVVDELANDFPLYIILEENRKSQLIKALMQKRNSSVVNNVIEEMVVSEKLGQIFDMINHICEGRLETIENSYAYTSANFSQPLALSNISTGLKTFLIIKTLLLNGAIEEGGIIVLDEPEIHLHPEWQLLLAELIVLMHKYFNIHILLNTHSPYFLRAVQVYAAKYEITNNCKFYLTEISNDAACISDVTNCVDRIYAKLSRPLQRLEDERWEYD